MKPARVSVGFLTAFILTIFGLQWWQLPRYPAVLWTVFAVLAGIGAAFSILRNTRAWGSILLATIAGSALGFFSVARTTHVTLPLDVETYATGISSTLSGWVADAPDRRPTVTRYLVVAEEIEQNGMKRQVRGKVLVSDQNGWPRYQYGDPVTVRGTLTKPQGIDTFDYPAYLRLQGIRATVGYARIEPGAAVSAPADPVHRILRMLSSVREGTEARINRVFPEPHASLLAGLLTGSRRGIPAYLTSAFRTAGLSHIIAISGYNVTIILSLLTGLLFWLPIRARFPFLALGIIAFTLFVGAGAPVVRAAIMGILGLLALSTGRLPAIRLTILWTAFLMLLWKPAFLWDDASFQLSFLAIIGITELSAPLKRLLKRVPETLSLREALVATLAAQIATIPLTITLFRQISFVAPLANILVAPLIPLAMLLGFLATVLGALWLPLGLAVGYPAWTFLQAIISVAQWSAALPFAAITF